VVRQLRTTYPGAGDRLWQADAMVAYAAVGLDPDGLARGFSRSEALSSSPKAVGAAPLRRARVGTARRSSPLYDARRPGETTRGLPSYRACSPLITSSSSLMEAERTGAYDVYRLESGRAAIHQLGATWEGQARRSPGSRGNCNRHDNALSQVSASSVTHDATRQ
jgi:hypothetical protein